MNFLTDNWPVIMAAIAFVAWLVRLEGAVKAHDKRLELLEANAVLIAQMAADIAVIKNDMQWVKKTYEKHVLTET